MLASPHTKKIVNSGKIKSDLTNKNVQLSNILFVCLHYSCLNNISETYYYPDDYIL